MTRGLKLSYFRYRAPVALNFTGSQPSSLTHETRLLPGLGLVPGGMSGGHYTAFIRCSASSEDEVRTDNLCVQTYVALYLLCALNRIIFLEPLRTISFTAHPASNAASTRLLASLPLGRDVAR